MSDAIQAALCDPSAVAREQLRELLSKRVPGLSLTAAVASSLLGGRGSGATIWLVNMDANFGDLDRLCAASVKAGVEFIAYGSAAAAGKFGCRLARHGVRAPIVTGAGWAPLVEAICQAAKRRTPAPPTGPRLASPPAPAGRSPLTLSESGRNAFAEGRNATNIVAIGASTGGPEALAKVLLALPAIYGGIVVAMHTPAQQLVDFAARVGSRAALDIALAEEGSALRTNLVLLAPGDSHVEVYRDGVAYRTRLTKAPKVHHSRPSVDVLFHSIARCCTANAMGVMLTGIGEDGVAGMLAMRKSGSHTIAQDEMSSAVYGMPRRALDTGAAEYCLDLMAIPSAIKNWHTKRSK